MFAKIENAVKLELFHLSHHIETFIVAPSEYREQLHAFLRDYDRGDMKIDLVGVEEFNGSADAIREIATRIRSDFFCISADFLSQFSFVDMARLHRLQVSDCTVFFSVPAKDLAKNDVDREYIGLSDDGRLLMKTPVLDIEDENLTISKCLLNRTSSFTLRDDLMDMGVYLFSNWVVDVIVSNPSISSLKSDLLPFLLERQFQPLSYLRSNLPSLRKRNRALNSIEPWLTASSKPFSLTEVSEALAEEAALMGRSISISALSATASSADISTDDGSTDNCDFIRCFGLIYDPSLLDSSNSAGSIILTNVIHVPSYLALNKDIPLMQYNSRSPWSRVSNYQKKELSVIGENVDLSDKTITFKQSSIGANCRIGARTKLNNCVIMDNVVIGDK